MTQSRTAVPNRRPSDVFEFEHAGINYCGQVSRLLDGTPVEVFLDGGKPGTPVQHVARDSAVAVSLALQYGVPLQVLQRAITRDDLGHAAGPMGALLDIIAKLVVSD